MVLYFLPFASVRILGEQLVWAWSLWVLLGRIARSIDPLLVRHPRLKQVYLFLHEPMFPFSVLVDEVGIAYEEDPSSPVSLTDTSARGSSDTIRDENSLSSSNEHAPYDADPSQAQDRR